jgi:hypothetical protein
MEGEVASVEVKVSLEVTTKKKGLKQKMTISGCTSIIRWDKDACKGHFLPILHLHLLVIIMQLQCQQVQMDLWSESEVACFFFFQTPVVAVEVVARAPAITTVIGHKLRLKRGMQVLSVFGLKYWHRLCGGRRQEQHQKVILEVIVLAIQRMKIMTDMTTTMQVATILMEFCLSRT